MQAAFQLGKDGKVFPWCPQHTDPAAGVFILRVAFVRDAVFDGSARMVIDTRHANGQGVIDWTPYAAFPFIAAVVTDFKGGSAFPFLGWALVHDVKGAGGGVHAKVQGLWAF